MSDMPKVGAVSTRDGRRIHYAEGNRAHCGSGGALILGTPVELREEHLPLLCRRCLPALRRALADASAAAVAAEGSAYDEATVQTLAELAEALQTPAERDAAERCREALAARIRADLLASKVLVPGQPEPIPALVALPHTWRDIYDEFEAIRHPIAA